MSSGELNVAAELAGLRGEMHTSLAEIKGQLALVIQSTDGARDDVQELGRRVEALEERRWPLAPMAAVSGAVSAVVAAVAFLAGR